MMLVIVGKDSVPVYQSEIGRSGVGVNGESQEAKHLYQFVAHSSLDIVEELRWTSKDPYLKVIDSFNDILVSAYDSFTNVTFLLLHTAQRNDESIKAFFHELNGLYNTLLRNPFYQDFTSEITSKGFHEKVLKLAEKYHL